MHDIGTSQVGAGWGREMAGEFEQEFMGEYSSEFGEVGGQFGNEYEFEFETAGVMSEMQEMELAAELLSVSNEQELENFLGKLIGSAAKAAGSFLRSDAGRALGGILRNAAKSALPIAGAALGNLVAPGVGGMIGGKLASMAGNAFGLELEGMSNEDREYEVARRVVRLANTATQRLAQIPANVPAQAAAHKAFIHAAKQVAPGIVNGSNMAAAAGMAMNQPSFGAAAPCSCQSGGRARSGRWVKKGNVIVLYPQRG